MSHKLLVLIPPGPLTAAAQAKKRRAFVLEESTSGVNANGDYNNNDTSNTNGLLPHVEDGYRKFVVFANPGDTVGELKENILAQYKKLFARDGTSVPKNIPFLKDADGFVCDDGYAAAECFSPGSKVYAEKPARRLRKRNARMKTGASDEADVEEQPYHQLPLGEDEDEDDDDGESTPEPTTASAPAPLPLARTAKEKKDGQPTAAKKQKLEKADKAKSEKKAGEGKRERKRKQPQQQAAEKSAAFTAPGPQVSAAVSPLGKRSKKHGAHPAAVPSSASSSKKVPSKVAPKKLATESEGSAGPSDSE